MRAKNNPRPGLGSVRSAARESSGPRVAGDSQRRRPRSLQCQRGLTCLGQGGTAHASNACAHCSDRSGVCRFRFWLLHNACSSWPSGRHTGQLATCEELTSMLPTTRMSVLGLKRCRWRRLARKLVALLLAAAVHQTTASPSSSKLLEWHPRKIFSHLLVPHPSGRQPCAVVALISAGRPHAGVAGLLRAAMASQAAPHPGAPQVKISRFEGLDAHAAGEGPVAFCWIDALRHADELQRLQQAGTARPWSPTIGASSHNLSQTETPAAWWTGLPAVRIFTRARPSFVSGAGKGQHGTCDVQAARQLSRALARANSKAAQAKIFRAADVELIQGCVTSSNPCAGGCHDASRLLESIPAECDAQAELSPAGESVLRKLRQQSETAAVAVSRESYGTLSMQATIASGEWGLEIADDARMGRRSLGHLSVSRRPGGHLRAPGGVWQAVHSWSSFAAFGPQQFVAGGARHIRHGQRQATALHVAASSLDEALVARLLAAGMDVDVRDSIGWTPLLSLFAKLPAVMEAAERGEWLHVGARLDVARSAELSWLQSTKGRDSRIQSAVEEVLAVQQQLLAQGASPNAAAVAGTSPLLALAANCQRLDTLQDATGISFVRARLGTIAGGPRSTEATAARTRPGAAAFAALLAEVADRSQHDGSRRHLQGNVSSGLRQLLLSESELGEQGLEDPWGACVAALPAGVRLLGARRKDVELAAALTGSSEHELVSAALGIAASAQVGEYPLWKEYSKIWPREGARGPQHSRVASLVSLATLASQLLGNRPERDSPASGCSASLVALVRSGAAIGQPDAFGQTALHILARHGPVHAIWALGMVLEATSSSGPQGQLPRTLDRLNSKDWRGNRPLHYVVAEFSHAIGEGRSNTHKSRLVLLGLRTMPSVEASIEVRREMRSVRHSSQLPFRAMGRRLAEGASTTMLAAAVVKMCAWRTSHSQFLRQSPSRSTMWPTAGLPPLRAPSDDEHFTTGHLRAAIAILSQNGTSPSIA